MNYGGRWGFSAASYPNYNYEEIHPLYSYRLGYEIKQAVNGFIVVENGSSWVYENFHEAYIHTSNIIEKYLEKGNEK